LFDQQEQQALEQLEGQPQQLLEAPLQAEGEPPLQLPQLCQPLSSHVIPLQTSLPSLQQVDIHSSLDNLLFQDG
jgi:hypothetical protein